MSLRQKSYSILERNIDCIDCNNQYCNKCTKCKGIRKQKVSHKTCVDIVERKHTGVFSYFKCTYSENSAFNIQNVSRKFLGSSDGNRVWITENYSLPVGHFSLSL